jgi:predicted nucleotidyltransferase
LPAFFANLLLPEEKLREAMEKHREGNVGRAMISICWRRSASIPSGSLGV